MQSRRKMFWTGRQRQSNKYLFSTLIVCKRCGWSFRYADNVITRQELDQKLDASKTELLQLEEELRQMQLHDLNDADIDRVIRRTMDHLKDFVSVRKLNNAQLKQLVEKIEVDEDGTVDVYLRLFERMEQIKWGERIMEP